MDDRVKHHQPTSDLVIAKHQAAREAADAMLNAVKDIAPDGREKSLAMTKIEEALFWTNAAIARNQ